jgi:hypothetical protein
MNILWLDKSNLDTVTNEIIIDAFTIKWTNMWIHETHQ